MSSTNRSASDPHARKASEDERVPQDNSGVSLRAILEAVKATNASVESLQADVDRLKSQVAVESKGSSSGRGSSGGEEEPEKGASEGDVTEAEVVGEKRTSNSATILDPITGKRRVIKSKQGTYTDAEMLVQDDSEATALETLAAALTKTLELSQEQRTSNETRGTYDENGVSLPFAVFNVLWLKKRNGLRKFTAYSESSRRGDKDELPIPNAVWSSPDPLRISLMWDSAVHASSVILKSGTYPIEFRALVARAAETYGDTLLKMTRQFLVGSSFHVMPDDSKPFFATSVFPQLYDRAVLEEMEGTRVWHIHPCTHIYNRAVEKWVRFTNDQPSSMFKLTDGHYRYCPVHGLQFDHDERVCPTLAMDNGDGTVQAASLWGRIPAPTSWKASLQSGSWKAKPPAANHKRGSGSKADAQSGGGNGGRRYTAKRGYSGGNYDPKRSGEGRTERQEPVANGDKVSN